MSFLAYECTELHIYIHTHTHSHIHIYLTLSLCSKDCILFMYLLRPSPLRVVSVCGEHLGRRECCTVHRRGQHLSAQKPRNVIRSLHPSIFCILRTLAEIPELLFLSTVLREKKISISYDCWNCRNSAPPGIRPVSSPTHQTPLSTNTAVSCNASHAVRWAQQGSSVRLDHESLRSSS